MMCIRHAAATRRPAVAVYHPGRTMTAPDRPPLTTEIIAGVTTFFTMAYIVIVNPTILSSPGTGMPFSGVLTATVLVCSTMTLLMGLYAKLPFGVAPGMGLNAFFTYTIVLQGGVPWPIALGIVFWAGVLFLVVSATNLREAIAMAIPESLRLATSAGIGLLLTFIGLQNAGFVADNPATLVGAGRIDHRGLLTLGAIVIIVFLNHRPPRRSGNADASTGHPLAYLAGIFFVTAVAWIGGWVTPPASWVSTPDFSSVFFKLDILGALRLSLLPAIATITMTDLFDSLSTFIGVSQAAGLVDADGRPRNLRRGLVVDAFATLGAGLFGSSSGTAYVESIAGIRVGGRTGRTAVVTGAVLSAVPLHRAARSRRSAVRHSSRAHRRRRVDVSDRRTRAVRSGRGRHSGVCDAHPDSADVFHHAGYPLGIRPARGVARRDRPHPRAQPRRHRPGRGFRGATRAGTLAMTASVPQCLAVHVRCFAVLERRLSHVRHVRGT